MLNCEVVNTNTLFSSKLLVLTFCHCIIAPKCQNTRCSQQKSDPHLHPLSEWMERGCVGRGCVLCYYQIKRFQTTNTTNIYFSRENGWKIFPHFSISTSWPYLDVNLRCFSLKFINEEYNCLSLVKFYNLGCTYEYICPAIPWTFPGLHKTVFFEESWLCLNLPGTLECGAG